MSVRHAPATRDFADTAKADTAAVRARRHLGSARGRLDQV